MAHYVHRVAMCHRGIDSRNGYVTVMCSPDGERAEYSGVQTCGSQWHCAICAPKIAARQVEQMNLALQRWQQGAYEAGGTNYFATYTNQHGRDDAGKGQCKAQLDRMTDALGYFKGTRAYLAVMESIGSAGLIRGLETTYGELNGWHHHTHEIIFGDHGGLVFDRKGGVIRHQSPLFKLARPWARVLLKFGMGGIDPGDIGAAKFRKMRHLLQRCYDVRPGAYAADYVAKFGREPESERGRWGFASELAKSHLKVGATEGLLPQRCDHASPWALLNDALDGDERSGELWREFALAFKGRSKLYWSKGLKARLNIPHTSEIEFAREPDARCTVPTAEISPIQWRLVIAHDVRFTVLKVAALHGRQGVHEFLEWLSGQPPGHSGEFEIVDRWPDAKRMRLVSGNPHLLPYQYAPGP